MKNSHNNKKTISTILDTCYNKALTGIPKTKTCFELSSHYLEKYKIPEIAARKFINYQIAKCTASGFITGLGGLITLPVSVPANITSVLYVQLRMIATIASIGGYDPSDDEVQTLAYLCLIKSSVIDVCKNTGIKIANKSLTGLLKKMPATILTKINQKVGFRLLTKFGEKGIINIHKAIPVAGGIVGGSIDLIDTKAIAKRAYNLFILDKLDNLE